MHLAEIHHELAALTLERCRRMHVTGCSILDCDGVGLLLDRVDDSTFSNCVIRDDRPDRKPVPSLRVLGGQGNEFNTLRLGNGEDRQRP
jgi:hypothetical protein